MVGISRGVNIYFYHSESDAEPYRVITKSLLEFAVWFERMRAQGSGISPNGMTGVIITTGKRFIVAEAQ